MVMLRVELLVEFVARVKSKGSDTGRAYTETKTVAVMRAVEKALANMAYVR